VKYDLTLHVSGTCVHFRRRARRCAAGHAAHEVADENNRLPCQVLGADQLPPCTSRQFRSDEEAQRVIGEVRELVSDHLER
jgi:hypothetical protein